ncbi:MAG: hypothetical protein R8M45_08280, partial [Ghiorsea sp.]
ADIIFPAATGNWGTATHIAIIDAAGYGLGNWLYHGALTASKIVNLGDTLKIPAGSLVLSLN